MMKVSSQYYRWFRRTYSLSRHTKRSASENVLFFGDADDILALSSKNVTLEHLTKRKI
jgi:hypothetical protein